MERSNQNLSYNHHKRNANQKSINSRSNNNNRGNRNNNNNHDNRSDSSNRIKHQTNSPSTNCRNCSTKTYNARNRTVEKHKCTLCNRFHAVKNCRKFLSMDVKTRKKFIESNKYCLNCLARSHDWRACASMDRCKKCDAFHHTLLHPKQRSITTRELRQRCHKQQRKPTSTTQLPTPTTTPSSTSIISEAIKSLAAILCSTK